MNPSAEANKAAQHMLDVIVQFGGPDISDVLKAAYAIDFAAAQRTIQALQDEVTSLKAELDIRTAERDGSQDGREADNEEAQATIQALAEALREIEDHHNETDAWRDIARTALDEAKQGGWIK